MRYSVLIIILLIIPFHVQAEPSINKEVISLPQNYIFDHMASDDRHQVWAGRSLQGDRSMIVISDGLTNRSLEFNNSILTEISSINLHDGLIYLGYFLLKNNMSMVVCETIDPENLYREIIYTGQIIDAAWIVDIIWFGGDIIYMINHKIGVANRSIIIQSGSSTMVIREGVFATKTFISADRSTGIPYLFVMATSRLLDQFDYYPPINRCFRIYYHNGEMRYTSMSYGQTSDFLVYQNDIFVIGDYLFILQFWENQTDRSGFSTVNRYKIGIDSLVLLGSNHFEHGYPIKAISAISFNNSSNPDSIFIIGKYWKLIVQEKIEDNFYAWVDLYLWLNITNDDLNIIEYGDLDVQLDVVCVTNPAFDQLTIYANIFNSEFYEMYKIDFLFGDSDYISPSSIIFGGFSIVLISVLFWKRSVLLTYIKRK